VKQRCLSEDFIVINDKLERSDRVFYFKQRFRGREQDTGETERERERERQRIVERERWHRS
jgi:hypothetical protein